MDLAQAQEASDLLVRLWREGAAVESLPAEIRPASRLEGYAIQAQLERLSAKPLWGWKIAATSEAGQRHIGVGGPIAGRLLAEMVYPDGAEVPFGANRMRVAEAEFAFRMGRSLLPRRKPYSTEEVLDSVAALHTALEVPDSRFADFVTAGAAQLIADNACAHQFILGPEAPAYWRKMNLDQHHIIGKVAGRYERDGYGRNVLGDPRIALTWLANELSQHGITLAAGQVVTTGTCVVPLEIQPGDEVFADYGKLGVVRLRFTPN
ncbi:MAG: 2-keto-4-pentenoate hydratase [Alphaproteobacteria bacterium]